MSRKRSESTCVAIILISDNDTLREDTLKLELDGYASEIKNMSLIDAEDELEELQTSVAAAYAELSI